jgi:hypothetical protein
MHCPQTGEYSQWRNWQLDSGPWLAARLEIIVCLKLSGGQTQDFPNDPTPCSENNARTPSTTQE